MSRVIEAPRIRLRPADDLTPLPGARWALGLLTFALQVSLLLSLSHSLWPAAGLHRPYL